MNSINIVCGDEFCNYIKTRRPGVFIPFKEAMILGDSSNFLFNKEFNEIRSKFHNVSYNEYTNHMDVFYKFLNDINSFNKITFWFGTDTFCQINLLTILAYLDYIKYKGNIYSVIIDDNSKNIVREERLLIIDDYYNKYISLVCNKKKTMLMDDYLNKAGNDYININSDEGTISNLIKNNSNLSNKELFELIWNNTRMYGLGDVQIRYLINKYSK